MRGNKMQVVRVDTDEGVERACADIPGADWGRDCDRSE